ncbi:hypothetical protein ACFLUO_09390 [Chloroflexota bacterium]
MADTLNETKLLSPPTGIRIAWALTGAFVNSPESKDIASAAKKVLDDLKQQADQQKGPEQEYVDGAVAVIQATLRTLDTIYKGREINFKENEKLRAVNWSNIEAGLSFGKSAKDFMKSLPTMAISTGAGVITFNQLFTLPSWASWLIGLGFAGIGYIINMVIEHKLAHVKQRLLIEQDYERNMYYEQYVIRVRTALINLYADIDRLHKKTFVQYYQLEASEDAATVVDGIIKGAMPTMCDYVHSHMESGRITASLWSKCETGGKTAEKCDFWGK